MMTNRVLIVDDDRTVRTYLAGLLGRSYEVITADSGEAALAIAAQEMPALVLLDVLMPGMDGYEVCRRLKAEHGGGRCQVIMVSAASSQPEQMRAFELGADAYLVKPIDPLVLCSEVRVHFRLREAMERMAAGDAQRDHLRRLAEQRDRDLADTQDVAVFALAKVAELRDEDTGAHLLRVRGYSEALAEDLRQAGPYCDQISSDFLSDLFRASPLHDIGKVGVSDTILLKPGRLTPEEFELVKLHTVLGANILQDIVRHSRSGGFLEMAVDVARAHHERFDGTGYPQGMRGTDIPLAARIVGLADVFDALTSRRPYKPPYPPLAARQIIRQEAGKQFDPAVVAAFETRFYDFLEIRRRYEDQPPDVPATLPADAAECLVASS